MQLSLNWRPTCWRRSMVNWSMVNWQVPSTWIALSWYLWSAFHVSVCVHRPQKFCDLLDSTTHTLTRSLSACYGFHSCFSPDDTSPSETSWAKWKTHSMARCQEKTHALHWSNAAQTCCLWESVNLSSSHSVLVCPECSTSLGVSAANQNGWSYNVISEDQDTYTNRRQKNYFSPV